MSSKVLSTIAKANEGNYTGSYKAVTFVRESPTPLVVQHDGDSLTVAYIMPLFANDGTCRAVVEVSYFPDSYQYVLESQSAANLLIFIMLAVAIGVVTILLWLANMWKRTARTWASADYGLSYEQSQAALETELALVKNAQAPCLPGCLPLVREPAV